MRKTRYILITLLAASTVACADNAQIETEGLEIRSIAAASCEQHGNNNEAFPVGADSFVIQLNGTGLDEPFVQRIEKDGDGPYVLTGIPPAENLTLDLVACNGSTPLAAGRTEGVDVLEHQKTFPPVFLTPIGGQTACLDSGDDVASSHAFGSLARGGDRVLAMGGLGSYTLEGSVGVAKATDSISSYERLTGSRATLPNKLANPRAMATTLVNGSQVRLIGGAGVVKLNTPNFDLWPSGGSSPVCGVELVNLSSGIAECESDTSLPAGGSGTQVSAEVAVYAGGVEEGGDVGIASAKLFVVEASGITELAMPQARVGASVVRLSDTKALVWGGNFDVDLSASALIVDVASMTVTPSPVSGEQVPVAMWSSAVYAGEGPDGAHQVLVAGGTDMKMTNDTVSAPIPPSGAFLYLLSVSEQGTSIQSVTMTADETPHFKRVAASLFDAGDGDYWLLGGVTSYTSDAEVCTGQTSGGCFPEAMARFTLSGSEPTLQMVAEGVQGMSVGPLGARAIDLGDESSLIVGGLRSAGDDALDGNAELVRYGSSASSLCATTAP